MLDCGAGRVDTISVTRADVLDGCENFFLGVSTLKVSGNHVELSWTHPRSWRKLRRLVLYVMEDLGAEGFGQVGEVHINVAAPALRDGLRRRGRARRPDHPPRQDRDRALRSSRSRPAWGGSKLAFELEAVDLGGHPDSHGPLE